MRRILSGLVGIGLRLIIRIIAATDTSELSSIPKEGPLILVFNHVNFLEVPLLYLRLKPRKIHYLAKSETWNNPFMGWMADNWQSVSVKRGMNPLDGFRSAGEFLEKGEILLISPEGSRSEDGILRKGRDGTAIIALQNDALIIPVGHTGAEKIRTNLRHFKRTSVKYRVGKPFKLNGNHHPEKEQRQQLTDAIMHELARLLPPEQRGIYRDMEIHPGLIKIQ